MDLLTLDPNGGEGDDLPGHGPCHGQVYGGQRDERHHLSDRDPHVGQPHDRDPKGSEWNLSSLDHHLHARDKQVEND